MHLLLDSKRYQYYLDLVVVLVEVYFVLLAMLDLH
jgi:hypothetical protein